MQKRIELSVLPLLCVSSLSHFPKLLLFCPSHAGCPAHTSGIESFDPFWPVRKPILLGLAPTTPAPFYSSLCPPSCPNLSHAFNPLTFFFLLSPTLCPSVRVIWSNQTLFLGGPRSPLTRSSSPYHLPNTHLQQSPRNRVLLASFPLCLPFFEILTPLLTRQRFSFDPSSTFWPCLALVFTLFLAHIDGLRG